MASTRSHRHDAAVPDVRERAWAYGRPTALLVALLLVAAGSGLFLDGYRAETPFARNGFRGADVITLMFVTPLLAWSGWRAARGSVRAHLLWLGAVGYVAYQYAYVFAYSWSRLFPVHLVLLSASGFLLASALTQVDPDAVAREIGPPSSRHRATARFLTGLGIALAAAELLQVVPAIVQGDTPQLVIDTGHPTSPVYILDLGLVVPLLLLTGRGLRAGRSWGVVAAPILLVKGASVGAGLLAANLFAAGGGRTDGPLNALWAAITVGGIALLWHELAHAKEGP
jgi:hypothetical protein